MPQLAVRLEDNEVAALDALVAEGQFSSRTEAVRAALAAQRRAAEDRRIAEVYARGYGTSPTTTEERDFAVAAAALVSPMLDDGGYDLAELGIGSPTSRHGTH